MTEPQDYLDLDAAGFLLIALGHLTAAMEKLGEMPKSAGVWKANRSAQWAANQVRYALAVLAEEKEETCKES